MRGRKKKNNIVIFNLKEIEGEDEGNKKDREVAMCSDILSHEIGVPQAEIRQVTRLGRPREGNTKPRPLLIKVGDVKDKWEIIKKAKNIKKHPK